MTPTNELYQVKEDTRQNSQDITKLTRVVDRLALMFENSEKIREEDRTLLRDMGKLTQTLSDRVSEVLHMATDVLQLKEDFRVARHDLNGAMQSIEGIVAKVEALGKNEVQQDADIKTLTAWHEREREKALKETGGEELKTKYWKTMTAIVGAIGSVGAVIVWFLGYMFK